MVIRQHQQEPVTSPFCHLPILSQFCKVHFLVIQLNKPIEMSTQPIAASQSLTALGRKGGAESLSSNSSTTLPTKGTRRSPGALGRRSGADGLSTNCSATLLTRRSLMASAVITVLLFPPRGP